MQQEIKVGDTVRIKLDAEVTVEEMKDCLEKTGVVTCIYNDRLVYVLCEGHEKSWPWYFDELEKISMSELIKQEIAKHEKEIEQLKFQLLQLTLKEG